MEFSKLNNSINLYRIATIELDKSYFFSMVIEPRVNFRLTQEIYTYICRCVDLNFGYTDYLEAKFNFVNEEEYFRCADYLLKNRTKLSVGFTHLSLYDKEELITELGI